MVVYGIFSYGKPPFHKIESERRILSIIHGAKVVEFLKKPSSMSNELYEIITECWNYHQNCRPSFGKSYFFF